MTHGTGLLSKLTKTAKRFAKSASEVLVLHQIGRERIMGRFRIDSEVLEQAKQGQWIRQAVSEARGNYSDVAESIFDKCNYQPDELAMWCGMQFQIFDMFRMEQ